MQERLATFMLSQGQPCTFEDNLPEDDSDVEAIAPPYPSEKENDSETSEDEDDENDDDYLILNNPANLGVLASESDSDSSYHDSDSHSAEEMNELRIHFTIFHSKLLRLCVKPFILYLKQLYNGCDPAFLVKILTSLNQLISLKSTPRLLYINVI